MKRHLGNVGCLYSGKTDNAFPFLFGASFFAKPTFRWALVIFNLEGVIGVNHLSGSSNPESRHYLYVPFPP